MSKLLCSLARKSILWELQLSVQSSVSLHPLCVNNYVSCFVRTQHFSKSSAFNEKNEGKSLTNVKPEGGVQVSFKTTVKETTKTASYMGVILLGVGVTGIMFYAVFSELFSSKSPNSVYSKALDRVINDTRIQDAIGIPISGYGEETSRGRRRHVSHLLYKKDGQNYLRMKFYVSGSRKRATVHLEVKENDVGDYMYRYLFVELDDFGRAAIVLEDNRSEKTASMPDLSSKQFGEFDLSQPLKLT